VEYWSPAGLFYLVLVLPPFFFPGWPFYRLAGFWLVTGFNALMLARLLAFEAFLPSSRGTGRWFFGCDRIAPPVL